MKSSKTFAVIVLAAICSSVQAQNPDQFVRRSGTKLTLAGAPYRYSGPNIEWAGLEGYGPHDPQGPRYPSHFEVDDAFATAAEMGARVVRSQTMGDTVGCPLCVEPTAGKFNEAAFAATDYALLAARQHGMRVIVTLLACIIHEGHYKRQRTVQIGI
jgi:mannan endo-1,4-beta-mannosidase